jgi:polyisoprenoid-binding protein YceI
MRRQGAVGLLVGAFLATAGAIGVAQAPLAIDGGRVTLAGTSNVHNYTASTTKIRVTKARIGAAAAGTDLWANALKPGVIEAFEIAIPTATLSSPKGDLDKNMLKALKAEAHPEITFTLSRFDARTDAPGAARAIGTLKIAGVEKEVALLITTKRTGATLTVQGSLDLLMTDYGITPPKALMGMLKTDPKVTVTFETVLAIPLT